MTDLLQYIGGRWNISHKPQLLPLGPNPVCKALAWWYHKRCSQGSYELQRPRRRYLMIFLSPVLTYMDHENIIIVAKGEDTKPVVILVHLSQRSTSHFSVQDMSAPAYCSRIYGILQLWNISVAYMSPNHEKRVSPSRTFFTSGIQNIGAYKASLSPKAVKPYTSLISYSPFSTQKKAAKLITVPL